VEPFERKSLEALRRRIRRRRKTKWEQKVYIAKTIKNNLFSLVLNLKELCCFLIFYKIPNKILFNIDTHTLIKKHLKLVFKTIREGRERKKREIPLLVIQIR
jgi:hypothetical protein